MAQWWLQLWFQKVLHKSGTAKDLQLTSQEAQLHLKRNWIKHNLKIDTNLYFRPLNFANCLISRDENWIIKPSAYLSGFKNISWDIVSMETAQSLLRHSPKMNLLLSSVMLRISVFLVVSNRLERKLNTFIIWSCLDSIKEAWLETLEISASNINVDVREMRFGNKILHQS